VLLVFALGLERSWAGEALAGVALAAWVVPLAMAGGAPWWTGVQAWLGFGATFVVATLAVRAVIQSARPKRAARLRVATVFSAILTVAVLAGLAVAHRLDASVGWAVVPAAGFSLVLGSAPPHPRHLKPIGWGLAAASALCIVTLAAGLR
jgi:hypothetical protein